MDYSSSAIWYAFAITTFAGLSTGIGSLLAFFTKTTHKKFLTMSLGFSAGVMIYVSMIEIFPQALEVLQGQDALGSGSSKWPYVVTTLSFFGGIAFIAIIDRLIPDAENPHEIRTVEDMSKEPKQNRLMRLGVFTALAIGIHNLPEGMATFTAALNDPGMGFAIAVAIAIHNIPEGIAVAVPIYFATKSRKKSFWYSFTSGLAEPVGALIAYLILLPFLTPTVFGIIFAAVAGIMVFISVDELLPAAHEFGEHHLSVYGLIAGMAIMAISLITLQ